MQKQSSQNYAILMCCRCTLINSADVWRTAHTVTFRARSMQRVCVTELNAWWNLCLSSLKTRWLDSCCKSLDCVWKRAMGKVAWFCILVFMFAFISKVLYALLFFVCIYLESMLISHTCLSEKQCYSQLFDFGVPCRNVCFCFGLCDSAHFHFIQWYFQPGLQVGGKPSVLPWKPENELGQRPTNPLHFSMTRGILKHHQFTVWSSSPSWCMSSIWQYYIHL